MVSSDRQDVDLSVSAQLGTLKDYARANGCSVARKYVDEAESGRVADRHRLGEMIEEGAKPNATFEVTLVWDFSHFIRKREHALAIEPRSSTMENRPSNVCGPAAPDVVLPHQQLGRLSALTESCLPPGSLAWHPETIRSCTWRMQMPEAAAMPIAGRGHAHRFPRRGRRSFAAYYRWVDDALRHRADGYRLLDSALVRLPGVQRLARQRFRRSAFAAVHAARTLLQQRRPSGRRRSLTPRQVLALQLYCEGQPMAVIATRPGLRSRQHLLAAYRRPAVEAVTRELLAPALGEFRSKERRIPVPLLLEGGNGLQIGLDAATGLASLKTGACPRGSSKHLAS